MVYPITAHAMGHQHDEDGGFVVEATTIQDPIGFATTIEDENGPLWGEPLVETVRAFRRWIGLLVMMNDDNNGSVQLDGDGQEAFTAEFNDAERERMERRARLLARGAGGGRRPQVLWTGLITTHVQGTCRMGSDPRAVGGRRRRPVLGRQAALRRRRLARPADAVGEPLAHDHGARRPPGRPSRRRPARLPGVSRSRRRVATNRCLGRGIPPRVVPRAPRARPGYQSWASRLRSTAGAWHRGFANGGSRPTAAPSAKRSSGPNCRCQAPAVRPPTQVCRRECPAAVRSSGVGEGT